MATVTATFDTKEKTLVVTMDGKTVDNVHGVVLSKGYSDENFYCELTTGVLNKDEDYYTVQRLVASETPEGQKLSDAPESKVVPGFKVAETTVPVEADVANYFRKARESNKQTK